MKLEISISKILIAISIAGLIFAKDIDKMLKTFTISKDMGGYVAIGIMAIITYIISCRMMRKPVPVEVEKPVRKYKVTRGGNDNKTKIRNKKN